MNTLDRLALRGTACVDTLESFAIKDNAFVDALASVALGSRAFVDALGLEVFGDALGNIGDALGSTLRGRAFVDTLDSPFLQAERSWTSWKTQALEAEPSWTPGQALATFWKMGHDGANLGPT